MSKSQLYKLILYRLMLNILYMIKSLAAAVPLGICCVFITTIFLKKYERKKENSVYATKRRAILCLVFYIAVVVQVVILFRPWGTIQEIDIIPFDTYGGIRYIILYAAANAIAFMPVGILLPMIWEKMNSLKRVFIAGLSGSLLIEVFQLLLQCGVFQTEDLIMNTLGAGIGYWLYKARHK